MTDTNKKRGSSFRKIFPNLFFSNKSKEKTSIKNSNLKMNSECSTSRSNHYQTPQPVFARYDNRIGGQREYDERIYENLSTTSFVPSVNDSNSIDILSHHSSNSTLVSENVKNLKHQNTAILNNNETNEVKYMARPQVPPKPQNETYASQYEFTYPDVYYHSLEKNSSKISPLDKIEIYKASKNASKTHMQPASVGAEIKKVSTKFLISPKKEADVRIIQPTRARSLSPDKVESNNIEGAKMIKKERIVEKSYNYSAPTSPVAISHKIPNMPSTVSPYEHVRKTMIEAEEKRNSINKYYRNRFTPSPRSSTRISKSPLMSIERGNKEELFKKKTREKVEAFYWQKIKELKQKEDEYLLRQSLNLPVGEPKTYNRTYSNSTCSTPNTFITDSRSYSLSRGADINNDMNQAIYSSPHFIRGALERRTDSYISSRTYRAETDVIYRNPSKLFENAKTYLKLPSVQNMNTVSRYHTDSQESNNTRKSEPFRVKLDFGAQNYKNSSQQLRTASVTSSNSSYMVPMNNINDSKTTIRSMCSESESGSEVGEIQRILESRSQKEKRSTFQGFALPVLNMIFTT
ncbi:unnamed protein product [Euphydryas editha]|uniref:Uncharacterized protein n=1 Tax=Euphydryas editha TaxID=104508 RepID=A0AAU9UVR4_EUPED|nr:unnamed protein product [Euphydryas editha]